MENSEFNPSVDGWGEDLESSFERRTSDGGSPAAVVTSGYERAEVPVLMEGGGGGARAAETSGCGADDGIPHIVLGGATADVEETAVDTHDDTHTQMKDVGTDLNTSKAIHDTHNDIHPSTDYNGDRPNRVNTSIEVEDSEEDTSTESDDETDDDDVNTLNNVVHRLNKLQPTTERNGASANKTNTSLHTQYSTQAQTAEISKELTTTTTTTTEGHEWQGARPKTRREPVVNKQDDTNIVQSKPKTKHSKSKAVAVDSVSTVMETAKPAPVPIPAGSICIITISLKGTASVEKRKQAIQHVLRTETPTLVLFQEYLLERIHKWKDYPIPKHYEYMGNDKASLLVDSRGTRVSDACHTSKLTEIVKELKRTSTNQLRVPFPKDFNPIPRMCIKKVETKCAQWVKFICISWHGKPKKKTKLEMQAEFNYLMEFFRIIHERYKLPLCIGGDFGIDVAVIDSLVKEPFILHKYSASTARKKHEKSKKVVFEYFICTSELQLTNTSYLSLPNDGEVLKGVVEPVVTYLYN